MKTFKDKIQRGVWDWKGSGERFRVGDDILEDGEFGNYFAGYVGYGQFGVVGEFLVKTYGHIYSIPDEWPPWDDKGSRDMINKGIGDAYQDQQ